MEGPEIVARTMSAAAIVDEYGNRWQYHSRSDRHSKAACWAILYDLIQHSPVLASHVQRQEVVFGINFRMVDFRNNRKKNLDLVVCTPGEAEAKQRRPHSFRSLVKDYGIQLSRSEAAILEGLPDLREGSAGAVRLALEAKACMTAHTRALPRLYDELNSSHLTIHGHADLTIAVGFVMVNTATTFVSPDLNRRNLSQQTPTVNTHKQPQDAQRVVAKVLEIPRRTESAAPGFDALAVVAIDCRNDGSSVKLVTRRPAPPVGDVVNYDSMITRAAQLYDYKFGRT